MVYSALHRMRQLPYLIHGLTGRFGNKPACPSCGSTKSRIISRKGFHVFLECEACSLLFRYPRESAADMAGFYQASYAEPGLTTELPGETELAQLLATGFAGSGKDFSWHIAMLRALGLREGDAVLDFGANWGYTTWQFRRAGFDAIGYELSQVRAAYASRLGVRVETDLEQLPGPFRAAFSCHVIEHVPNPRATIEDQLARLSPGGLVVALTPNGTAAYRDTDRDTWQRTWGQVHPVLLAARFAQQCAGRRPYLITTDVTSQRLSDWDQKSQQVDACAGPGLLIVVKHDG